MLALLMLLQTLGPPDDETAAAQTRDCRRTGDEIVVCADPDQSGFRIGALPPKHESLPPAKLRLSKAATADVTARPLSGLEPGVAAMVTLKVDF